MVPDVNVALERARIIAKINHLAAQGTALLLQSLIVTVPGESESLREEAGVYLDQADVMRDSFAARFPKALNLYQGGR